MPFVKYIPFKKYFISIFLENNVFLVAYQISSNPLPIAVTHRIYFSLFPASEKNASVDHGVTTVF
jgi:hypothetical protein